MPICTTTIPWRACGCRSRPQGALPRPDRTWDSQRHRPEGSFCSGGWVQEVIRKHMIQCCPTLIRCCPSSRCRTLSKKSRIGQHLLGSCSKAVCFPPHLSEALLAPSGASRAPCLASLHPDRRDDCKVHLSDFDCVQVI